MAQQVEAQMQRLNAARTRAQELTQEKSRITGEVNALKKRQAELEKRSKDEFECKVEELPALMEQLEKDAEASLANAEVMLGLREGQPIAAPTQSEESEDEPIPDDDGLGI